MWTLHYKPKAQKALLKLEKQMQAKIIKYLEQRVAVNPKKNGKALVGNKRGFWRY